MAEFGACASEASE